MSLELDDMDGQNKLLWLLLGLLYWAGIVILSEPKWIEGASVHFQALEDASMPEECLKYVLLCEWWDIQHDK